MDLTVPGCPAAVGNAGRCTSMMKCFGRPAAGPAALYSITITATYDSGQYHEMKWTFEAMIIEKSDDPGTAPDASIGGVSWGVSVAPDGSLTGFGSSAIITVSDGFQGAFTRFYEVKHGDD